MHTIPPTTKDRHRTGRSRSRRQTASLVLGAIVLLLVCATAIPLSGHAADVSTAHQAAYLDVGSGSHRGDRGHVADATKSLVPRAQATATAIPATPTSAATVQPTATAQTTVTPASTNTPQTTATAQSTATAQPTATVAPVPTQQNSSPPIIIPVQNNSGPNTAAVVLAVFAVLVLAALAGVIAWLLMRQRSAAPATPAAPVTGEWEQIDHVRVDPPQTPPYSQPGYGQVQPGEVYEGPIYPATPYHDQPTMQGGAAPPPLSPLPEQEPRAYPSNDDGSTRKEDRIVPPQWGNNEPPISPNPNG